MTIVGRAVIAGVLGGILAALFVALVGEESIDAAIAIEEAARVRSGEPEADPIFGRGVQVIGGLLGAVLYGVFTGVVFGTVFAAVRHRLPLANDFRRSLLLTAIAFMTTALIPALKYPANPPAVGDPDTVGQRTLLFFTLIGAALVLACALGLLWTQLRERLDSPTASVLTSVAGIVGFIVLMVVWPANPDAVPADFPADLMWRFRLQSLATLAVSWATIGLALGWLLSRVRTPVSV